jgi:LacI family transcriptional regulator
LRRKSVPTIREVSSLAGVSISTVSRVLNNTVPVANETKQRVLEAVEKLEYHPNAFARSLVTNRSGCLGVIVGEINSPFFGELLKGIEDKAESLGMHLIVSSGHAQEASETRALHFLQQRRPDALIVYVEALGDEALQHLTYKNVPVVVLGRFIKDTPCVYLDNEEGGFTATQYLIQQGHRCVAHLSGPTHLPDSVARLKGYQKALESHALPYDPALVAEGNFSEGSGYETIKVLLSRAKDFTALFVANDQMAAGVLRALREAGLRVPEDISVIGYDDIPLAKFLYPLLTTIRQPLTDMGQAAADIALARLNGQETEVRKFEPQLVIRESVRSI